MSNQKAPNKTIVIVLWLLWAPIMFGMVFMHLVIAPAPSQDMAHPQSEMGIMSIIGICIAVVSMGLRWLVIPRIKSLGLKTPFLIIGVFMAEGIGMIALFAVPTSNTTDRGLLLFLSYACLVLSAPIYAKFAPRSESEL